MKQITNYPNQDDYETEEEFNEAQELYWMELDRQYDMWKDEQRLEKGKKKMINKYVLMCSILFIFLLAYLVNELSLAFKNVTISKNR